MENYRKDPRRVDFEKQAFASCHHPFIINLDYAFQTDSCAIFVLDLANGLLISLTPCVILMNISSIAGDLNQAIKASPFNSLSEARVVFYAAECALALNYMHQLGLMYRDLKVGYPMYSKDQKHNFVLAAKYFIGRGRACEDS